MVEQQYMEALSPVNHNPSNIPEMSTNNTIDWLEFAKRWNHSKWFGPKNNEFKFFQIVDKWEITQSQSFFG